MAWFDATQIDPAQGSSGMPIGRYPVVIKGSSQVAAQNDPSSGMIVFQCEIIDGPQKGIVGSYRLNIWNKNEQAREIASRQLSALCHVTGRHQLEAEPKGSELFNIPFVMSVIQSKDDRYTEVSGVFDMAGNAPTKGVGPAMNQGNGPGGGPVTTMPPFGQPNFQPQQSAPQAVQPVAQPVAQPQWQQPAQPGAAPQQPAQQPVQQPTQQPSWSQQPGSATPSWQR